MIGPEDARAFWSIEREGLFHQVGKVERPAGHGVVIGHVHPDHRARASNRGCRELREMCVKSGRPAQVCMETVLCTILEMREGSIAKLGEKAAELLNITA